MHLLIKRKSTGNSEEFACKMNLSRSQLMEHLSELRTLGAPIKYCKFQQIYLYEYEWEPFSKDLNLNKCFGGYHYDINLNQNVYHTQGLDTFNLRINESN